MNIERFVAYLKQRKIREMSKREISDSLKAEGYIIEKDHYYKDMDENTRERSTAYFIVGLKEKKEKKSKETPV